jgi:hypothetical protein
MLLSLHVYLSLAAYIEFVRQLKGEKLHLEQQVSTSGNTISLYSTEVSSLRETNQRLVNESAR